ncbi:uncharacterized protein G2W53_028626 [Senna tora]|uniref:Uncharacterized protein n=1 Tax=Senna tora TaxID=362788 RepID=A0A834W9W5_9FABA|nr:uncharacterized protein G2W53_028626 [Senna tora]
MGDISVDCGYYGLCGYEFKSWVVAKGFLLVILLGWVLFIQGLVSWIILEGSLDVSPLNLPSCYSSQVFESFLRSVFHPVWVPTRLNSGIDEGFKSCAMLVKSCFETASSLHVDLLAATWSRNDLGERMKVA